VQTGAKKENAMNGSTGLSYATVHGATAPAMVDPGEQGWPEPPGVTDAEIQLYGAYAGAMRLAGQAAVNAEKVYCLVCRALGEFQRANIEPDDASIAARSALVDVAYAAHMAAARSYRELAVAAVRIGQEDLEAHGRTLTGPNGEMPTRPPSID